MVICALNNLIMSHRKSCKKFERKGNRRDRVINTLFIALQNNTLESGMGEIRDRFSSLYLLSRDAEEKDLSCEYMNKILCLYCLSVSKLGERVEKSTLLCSVVDVVPPDV